MTARILQTRTPLELLAAVLLGLVLLAASPVQAAPFAYIANSNSNNVSVIDTASNTVTATVAVGTSPRGVAVNPAGTRVYVANFNSGNVSVIDTASNTVTATVAVVAPQDVAVNPAGTRVYVTNSVSNTVSVIDTTSNTVIATVAVGSVPRGVAVNPAGTRVYVANSGTTTVSVIDTATNSVIGTTSVGTGPFGVAVNPAGTRVYVANQGSNNVSVIDTASITNTAIDTVAVGTGPSGVAVNPAGTRVYVTNLQSSNVSVLDTTACIAVIDTVTVGFFPLGVAVNPAGTRVYVANSFSNNVSVIDTAGNTVTATVAVGENPWGLFIGPGGAVPPVPPTPIRVTGIEVTQAIQDFARNVALFPRRRTFARVHVISDGAAVAGVTASLSGLGTFGPVGVTGLGPLVPANAGGPRITVPTAPQRSNLGDSFLFELPWEWTNFRSLRLHASLSTPGGPPPASCATDATTAPTHEFGFATTLKVQFVRMAYPLTGSAQAEASTEEQDRSESWIRRSYPVSSLSASPDMLMFDAGLRSRVYRTAQECLDLVTAEKSLCAHYYVTSRLAALQASSGLFLGQLPGPPGSGFIGDADLAYALIPQDPTDMANPRDRFTRGACCNNRVGSGPANDDDYAAHEIGHFLGRQHPVPGAAECAHSASDPNYPYFLSFIAPPLSNPNTALAGFDGGDASLLIPIPMSFVPPGGGYDIMGYCQPTTWISDYTYHNLHSCLLAMNAGGTTPGCGAAGGNGVDALSAKALQGGPQAGDWLSAFGHIASDPARAIFFDLRRIDRIFRQPARPPGSHSIRLIGDAGAILADYSFAPVATDDATATQRSFGHVVPFVTGTRQIQIVHTAAGGAVIGSKLVSGNAPVVGNVALQGAPDPITGLATLAWIASDVDGDALSFDILAARSDSAPLQALMLGLSGSSAVIDTSMLGGGMARLRVVASDGLRTAFADSPPITFSNKPPRPRILTPGDRAHVYLGQAVNFEGEAKDPQDGVVADTGLAWSSQQGALGSGARISTSSLPVGLNLVTLTATNSVGLTATSTVSVIVDGNLDPPGPTLTAGPGQIGWHVSQGEVQLQTAELNIGNRGSGNLQFTVSSGAPWLTVNAATGMAPATLTLTANPAGFPEGVSEDTTVMITAVGVPGQVITVPVRLAVGNTFVVGNATKPVVAEVIYHDGFE